MLFERILTVPTVPSFFGWQRAFVVLGSFVLMVLCLFWAQKVLIPLALAVLVAFVLQPLVTALQRHGFRRLPAVILVVVVALAALGCLGWIFSMEAQSLAQRWPSYKANIEAKINQLDPEGNLLEKVQSGLQDFLEPINVLKATLAPVLETLIQAVFVTVLVVFMLLKREDLRNRLIRLLGQDRRTIITTRAMDEAAQRISRYLLMQLLINSAFGLALGVGLYVIGLDYALVWGFLAAILRFIPYVGTWVATIVPTLLSVATSEPPHEWLKPAEVLALFVGLELFTAYVMEPLLFGMTAGVSPIALLVAAIFWTWLWGPIGLVLSTPMTVCLFVLGKYVPHLEFLEILLGDEPALETSISYYQRLLARDQDEAIEVIEEQLQSHKLEEIYDDILIPALALTKRDRERGELPDEDEHYIVQATRELVNDLGTFGELVAKPVPTPETLSNGTALAPAAKTRVFGFPATDELGEVALEMFRHLMKPVGVEIEVTSAKLLSSEVIALIEKEELDLVLIASVPPGGLAQTRYLCKRLRSHFPDLKILVGRWGFKENIERTRQRLLDAGANHVATTLAESRCQLLPLVPMVANGAVTREKPCPPSKQVATASR